MKVMLKTVMVMVIVAQKTGLEMDGAMMENQVLVVILFVMKKKLQTVMNVV